MEQSPILQLFTFVIVVGGIVASGIGEAIGQEYSDAGKLGDQYFEAQQYYRASQYYQLAVQEDSTDYQRAFRLAESYRQQFKYQEALRWYANVSEQDARGYPEAAFYQALMLKNLGLCHDAVPIFTRLQQQPLGLSEKIKKDIDKALQGCYDLQVSQARYAGTQVQKLDSPVSSAYHDYAPMILQNDSTIVITSTRFSDKQRVSYRFGDNNANFFEFTFGDGDWVEKDNVAKTINTKASEGAGCYVKSRNEFYYTFCPENQPCEIYVIRQHNHKWTEPQPLSGVINQKNTNSKHPAVTAMGDTLFFVSDRPGGYGGTDLWMSLRAGENDWSPPVCLDTLINTPSDEVSPFYDSRENQLIFASNGHEGYGGMDVFMVTDFTNLAKRQNSHLPVPFNSNADDGYLVLGKQRGYLASNRNGRFDIFSFQKDTVQTWRQYLLGLMPLTALPEKKRSIIYTDRVITADVALPGEIRDWIRVQSAQQKRLASGATRFILNSDVNDIRFQQYQQQKRQSSEVDQSAVTIRSEVEPGLPEDNILIIATFSTDTMSDSRPFAIMGMLSESATSSPLAKQTIQLKDRDGNLVKVTTTNDSGNFRLVNVQPDTDYALVLTSNITADSIQVADLQIRHLENEPEAQSYESIFFDFNQDDLRPEAKKVLESLAEYYRQYPDISIEINAFTDSLGNDQYNLMLSQKRGEAAFQYLIEQGVDRSALAINAKGVSVSYTSTNTYVSQQLNRRVDFDLFGLKIPLETEVVTRMTRPSITKEQLLESTGMSLEDLQLLNGRDIEQLQPYKPLRLHKSAVNTASEALFYKIIDIN